MYGIIYVITNVVNGKQYVGQTKQSVVRRWRLHVRSTLNGSTYVLHCAIRKYGAEEFIVKQIDSAESLAKLNEKEALHILQLKTLAPSGYNLTTGGDSFKFSEETCRKISDSSKGKVILAKTRSKMSKALIGHSVSAKTKEKISLALAKQYCKQGHLFDEANTYRRSDGRKRCWTCHYLRRGTKLPQKLEKYLVKEKCTV